MKKKRAFKNRSLPKFVEHIVERHFPYLVSIRRLQDQDDEVIENQIRSSVLQDVRLLYKNKAIGKIHESKQHPVFDRRDEARCLIAIGLKNMVGSKAVDSPFILNVLTQYGNNKHLLNNNDRSRHSTHEYETKLSRINSLDGRFSEGQQACLLKQTALCSLIHMTEYGDNPLLQLRKSTDIPYELLTISQFQQSILQLAPQIGITKVSLKLLYELNNAYGLSLPNATSQLRFNKFSLTVILLIFLIKEVFKCSSYTNNWMDSFLEELSIYFKQKLKYYDFNVTIDGVIVLRQRLAELVSVLIEFKLLTGRWQTIKFKRSRNKHLIDNQKDLFF